MRLGNTDIEVQNFVWFSDNDSSTGKLSINEGANLIKYAYAKE